MLLQTRVEKKLQHRAEKCPMSFVVFSPIVHLDELRGGPSMVTMTKFTVFLETEIMEDKLVVAVAGYPELYMILPTGITMI